MKKVSLIVLIFLFTLAIVSAQNQTIDERAFSCLENELVDNCAKSGSVEQISFSLLAMADNSAIQSNCRKALEDKQSSDKSWNQKIKDTSLAIIALNNIGKDTSKEETWLLDRKIKPINIEWYLEIDANEKTKCSLNKQYSIIINEDKKISGNLGSCFSLAYENYWLKISSNCFQRNLTVSCDKNFISTTLYKKSNSNIWYVPSDIQSASAGGTTEHEVNSYCIGKTSCNYEDNLWALLALQKTKNDVTGLIPYITTLAEDNEKFFPQTFLYIAKNSEDYLQEIISLQEVEGYWELDKNKYYDTALALLSVAGSVRDFAIQWLGEVQGKDGCWNNDNIRDTSFILWAAFPSIPTTRISGDYCEDFNYYCISQGECDGADGSVLENFYCPGLKICCDKPALEKPEEKPEIKKISECEKYDYSCRTSCLEGEEKASYDCPSEKVCCKEKVKAGYSWLIILIILIILVILGIIFRNKLRIFIFKFRTGFKKGAVMKTRPTFPPGTGLRRMFPTRMLGRPTTLKRAVSETDKELEETLKKLKEIGGK